VANIRSFVGLANRRIGLKTNPVKMKRKISTKGAKIPLLLVGMALPVRGETLVAENGDVSGSIGATQASNGNGQADAIELGEGGLREFAAGERWTFTNNGSGERGGGAIFVGWRTIPLLEGRKFEDSAAAGFGLSQQGIRISGGGPSWHWPRPAATRPLPGSVEKPACPLLTFCQSRRNLRERPAVGQNQKTQ